MPRKVYHTIDGGSRRHGFHFNIYNPEGDPIGSLRKLRSETFWRLEMRPPSQRRILQMFNTFEDSVRYVERVLPLAYGDEARIL